MGARRVCARLAPRGSQLDRRQAGALRDSTAARLENTADDSTIFAPSQGKAGKRLPDGKEKSSPDLLIPLLFPMIIKPPPLRREMPKHLHTSPCLLPHASSLSNAQAPQGKQAQPVSPCCTMQRQGVTSCRLPDHSLEQSSQQGQRAKKNGDFRHDVQLSQCCVQHDIRQGDSSFQRWWSSL